MPKWHFWFFQYRRPQNHQHSTVSRQRHQKTAVYIQIKVNIVKMTTKATNPTVNGKNSILLYDLVIFLLVLRTADKYTHQLSDASQNDFNYTKSSLQLLYVNNTQINYWVPIQSINPQNFAILWRAWFTHKSFIALQIFNGTTTYTALPLQNMGRVLTSLSKQLSP